MEVFDAYFRSADFDHDGRISDAEAVTFFQRTNLPKLLRVSAPSDPARIADALRVKPPRLSQRLRFDRLLSPDDEGAMDDGFFEAFKELERMARDSSDVLGGMAYRLSIRELQPVLVYSSQEGQDS